MVQKIWKEKIKFDMYSKRQPGNSLGVQLTVPEIRLAFMNRTIS